MFRSLIIGATLALFVSPALAGPCTQRIAELEKAVTAKQEGAGPAMSVPATTGSTGQPTAPTQNQPATSTAQTQGANRAMQMLQEAKQLDQQGKEADCMQLTTQVSGMVPDQPK
jgi:hypothetical protein